MEDLPQFALHWATELGSTSFNLNKLQGGINNQVYLCTTERQSWVIKGYPQSKGHQRDRMKAEVQFLNFANEVAPELTPKLIYSHQGYRFVVLEHIEGKAFSEGIPPQADAIATAVQFIQLLNRDTNQARQWVEMDASEGFLCLSEHIVNVHKRLAGMTTEHIPRKSLKMALSLFKNIRTELEIVQEKTNKLIDEGVILDRIDPDKRCISPSDFGFHNAIMTAKGVRFIDFEFAGWDDPAKTTLDFILQPHVPVWGQGSPLSIVWDQELQASIDARCQVLGPILRLKWACIILSALNPSRLSQLLEIRSEEKSSILIQKRLNTAKAYLASTSKSRFSPCASEGNFKI